MNDADDADVVKRLRAEIRWSGLWTTARLLEEAAAEIERLRIGEMFGISGAAVSERVRRRL